MASNLNCGFQSY